jgi:hypothetical protein
LCFKNLAVNPVQLPQQFLSASVRVIFHGSVS